MAQARKSFIFILVICVIGVLTYLVIDWNEIKRKIAYEEVEKERGKWEKAVKKLEAEIAESKPEVKEERPELSVPELSLPGEKGKVDCERVKNRVFKFFEYLDGKEYLKKFKLKNGTKELYNKIMVVLSQRPPTGSEVGLDMETLISNSVHFYRALGKEPIQVLKEIENNEAGNLEMIMKFFFEYFMTHEHCPNDEIFVPSPTVRYDYASFFLNTLGGRSYILRRPSRTRVLVTYYCVLALHEANEKRLNRKGIDILPHLNQVMEEMSARNDLTLQKRYLEALKAVKHNYPSLN